jgi:hypothetical protein
MRLIQPRFAEFAFDVVFAGETETAMRLTVTPTVAAATAGKLTVRVWYVKKGRQTENLL